MGVSRINLHIDQEQFSKESCDILCRYSTDIVILLDSQGNILDANPVAVMTYGYSRDELLSMNIKDLRPPGEKTALESIFGTDTKAIIYEVTNRRKDGSTLRVEVHARSILVDDFRRILCIARDITDRRRVESAIARLAAIVSSSADAILAMTMDGVITDWNPGAERLYGYDVWDVIGKPINILIPHDRVSEVDHIIDTIKNGKYVFLADTVRVKKDGSPVHVSLMASPIISPAGGIIGVSWVARDITQHIMDEQKIRGSEEEAKLYLDLMTHDINNLNQVGLSYLELALEKLNESGILKDDTELIEKPIEAIKSSSRLINNIKKLQTSGPDKKLMAIVDLCTILLEVKDHYSNMPGRDITIDFSPPAECPVEASELVRDVFINIIGNAVKHSDPDKPLKVGVELKTVVEDGKKYYRVEIDDNGPGVPDELKNIIFQRLERGKAKVSGYGLGLYLVKTLIDTYNGRVWIEDRIPGDFSKGAKFVVLLPAA